MIHEENSHRLLLQCLYNFGYDTVTRWGMNKWPPFSDDIFKCIDVKFHILFQILQRLVPDGPIANTLELVRVKCWYRTDDQ